MSFNNFSVITYTGQGCYRSDATKSELSGWMSVTHSPTPKHIHTLYHISGQFRKGSPTTGILFANWKHKLHTNSNLTSKVNCGPWRFETEMLPAALKITFLISLISGTPECPSGICVTNCGQALLIPTTWWDMVHLTPQP